MYILQCEKAYRKNGDRRGRIMCQVSGLFCAHTYWCELAGKFKQTDSAKDCPGRSGYEQQTDQKSPV